MDFEKLTKSKVSLGAVLALLVFFLPGFASYVSSKMAMETKMKDVEEQLSTGMTERKELRDAVGRVEAKVNYMSGVLDTIQESRKLEKSSHKTNEGDNYVGNSKKSNVQN